MNQAEFHIRTEHDSVLALQQAVLIYRGAQGSAFATVHDTKASPDGGAPYLDAGQTLTIDFLTQLAKGLGRTTQCEILPPNVLAYTPDLLVWWTRRQQSRRSGTPAARR